MTSPTYGQDADASLMNLSLIGAVSSGMHTAAPFIEPASKLGGAIWSGVDPNSAGRYGDILPASTGLAGSIIHHF